MKRILKRTILPFILLLISIFLLWGSKLHAQSDSVRTNPAKNNITKGQKIDSTHFSIWDLNTGKPVQFYYDTSTWRAMNRNTNQAVDYYVIRYNEAGRQPDTVHGITGLIVNGMILKSPGGTWDLNSAMVKWDGQNEMKIKDNYGRVIKWQNGELKVKDWNRKYKVDKSGETKYVEEWNKVKWRNDEPVKTKVDGMKNKTSKDQQ